MNPDLLEVRRRQLLLSLGASLLGAPVMAAAAAPGPVVAVPFYGAATLLRMQRRHAWLPAARQWREAAEVLGATTGQYWRMVALPILFPSLLGTFALLFANAFGAVATAIALTGSSLNIVPIQLYAQIRGDVLGNPNLGYALAFGMIVVTAIANVVYIWLRVRAERWLK